MEPLPTDLNGWIWVPQPIESQPVQILNWMEYFWIEIKIRVLYI